ncbi:ShlB/FhaC/HecB family hemolysin secretion/activation protein [Selenomonas ruminantium]|uniref:ShlB/FhaC/HecB family hemolysin secretion/activation protein n=1 Tax=Selenomonas ruminantium TaxID=971 RepID=UPI0026F14AF9|nr:ShlB/FhaC/HecB family hemolysin secretion/activation protein [Selenomonas ruminantium]
MKRYDTYSFIMALALGFMGAGQTLVEAAVNPTDIAGMQMERDRRDIEREQVREQIAEDEAARKSQVEQGEASSSENADTEIHFELKKVEWNPSAILTQEELQAVTEAYIGRQITAKDLLEMTDKITALYREKGYMTCGAVLNRRIHDGVAKVRLVEGRTENVSVSGNRSTRENYITGRLGLKPGEIANIAKLNKDLRWFHGTNDIQLRVVIKPGAAEGTTDYEIIALEPQNQTVTLYLDNDGYDNSGRWRQGIFYAMRSLSGYRDALRGSFIRSQGTKAWTMGYSIPLSQRGMRLDLNYSGNRTKITNGELKKLGVRGKAQSFSLNWRVPFYITAHSRHETGLQYIYQTSKTDWGYGSVSWTDDKINRVIPYVSFTHYGNSSVFYHKHSFVFAKRRDIDGNSDSANLYRLSSFWQKRYGGGQFWQARLEGQWSSEDNLASSDRFFIGGVTSVRGYEEGFIGGPKGMTANLEYHVPLDKARRFSLFPFVDWGTISGVTGMEHRTLLSAGLGLEARYKQLYSTLSVGFPIKKDFYETSVDSTRVDFSLSATF